MSQEISAHRATSQLNLGLEAHAVFIQCTNSFQYCPQKTMSSPNVKQRFVFMTVFISVVSIAYLIPGEKEHFVSAGNQLLCECMHLKG